jgi:hypothetical protein
MDTSKQTVSKASNLRDQSSSTISSASSSSSSSSSNNFSSSNFHLRGDAKYAHFYVNKESLRQGYYPYTSATPGTTAATMIESAAKKNAKPGLNHYPHKKSNFNWQLNEFNDYYM